MTRTAQPFRWCESLVAAALPASDREEVLGNLHERFVSMTNRRGSFRAHAWYVGQAVRLLANARRSLRSPIQAGGRHRWLHAMDQFEGFGRSVRTLARSPLFTVTTAGTVVLGVAAVTATYSVLDSVLLTPLPYPQPERLVSVSSRFQSVDETRGRLSGPEIALIEGNARQIESVGAVWARFASLTDGDDPEQVDIGIVNGNFFRTLGIDPYLGRFIEPADDQADRPPVLVLTYELWQRRYGGDSSVVGGTIQYNGAPHGVVGILPPGFRLRLAPAAALPRTLDVFVPWGGAWAEIDPDWHLFNGFARLTREASLEPARAELTTLATELRSRHAAYQENGLELEIVPLREDVMAPLRASVLSLFGAAVLVALIAWANSAALVSLRLQGRRRELAVRAALGASRTRMLGDIAAETFAIFVAGGLAGWWVASLALGGLTGLAPAALELGAGAGAGAVTANPLTATATTLTILFASLAVGAFPRLRRAAAPLLATGATGRRGPDTGRGGRRFVIAETAIAVTLMVGASLLLRTYWNLTHLDLGFDAPEGTMTARVSLPSTRYPYETPEPIADFYRRLEGAAQERPGVTSAGLTELLPLGAASSNPTPYAVRTAEGETDWGQLTAEYRVVTPGYFDAAGYRTLAGRGFEATETLDSPLRIVVGEELARRHWPEDDAVGRPIRVSVFVRGVSTPRWGEVIGVVDHVQNNNLTEDGRPQIYLAHAQSPRRSMTLVARTADDPAAFGAGVRAEVRRLDPLLPIFAVRPMRDYVTEAMGTTTLVLWLLCIFTGTAVVLALVGLCATTALHVRGRTAEIGVRLALGADQAGVRWLYARRGWLTGLTGLGIGLAGSAFAARALQSIVFGVSVWDLWTFGAVTMLTTGLTLLAAYLPAGEASRVDPVQAIQSGGH